MNNQNKFTPGPWAQAGTVVEDDIGRAVANCYQSIARHEDEARANARLIASAPECLAMLVRILEALPKDLSLDGLQLESDLEALIAKATDGAE